MLNLPDEFASIDTSGIGIAQPAAVFVLLDKLMRPGLSCDAFAQLLRQDLNLDVPDRELNKYFALMDTSGNGFLDAGEFVTTVRFVMLNFFPRHVMNSMNLSGLQIAAFLAVVLLNILAFFAVVTLVISAFSSGGSVSSSIHSGVSGLGAMASKANAEAQSGNNDQPSAVRAYLETRLEASVIAAMGLTSDVVDKLRRLATAV
jgi:hypothetical protein